MSVTFATEEEKQIALSEFRNPTEADLEKIKEIQNAEIKPSEEPNNVLESDIQNNEPAPAPVEEQGRNWTITEEMISQYNEDYTDETGRVRPFITHRTPEDFLRSYIDCQKNNNYLKTKRIPQSYEDGKRHGYDGAKSEIEQKNNEIVNLKAQLEEAKRVQPTQQPKVEETVTSTSELYKKLEETPDEDIIVEPGILKAMIKEHHEAITSLKSQKSLPDEDYINKLVNKKVEEIVNPKISKVEEYYQTNMTQQKQSDEAKKWESIYRSIDDFKNSPNAPSEVKVDQSYKDMTHEALIFHERLAELWTGRTANSYDAQSWNSIKEKAASEYLNNMPELISRVKSSGVREPMNYRAWVYLDNIDAVRNGMIRNSNNEWERRFSPNGSQVSFPDMESAYSYLLDQTGEREKMTAQAKASEIHKFASAANKRDNSVVQLDESKMSQGGGTEITEQDALRIITESNKGLGMPGIIAEYMKGNSTRLNELNAAYARVGQAPIDPKIFM